MFSRKYFSYKQNGKTRKLPIIEVLLNNNFSTAALIDSGAEQSAMNRKIVEALNLKLEKKEGLIKGLNAPPQKTEICEASISLFDDEAHRDREIPLILNILKDSPLDGFDLILGRADFFQKFHITFEEDNKKIRFKFLEDKDS